MLIPLSDSPALGAADRLLFGEQENLDPRRHPATAGSIPGIADVGQGRANVADYFVWCDRFTEETGESFGHEPLQTFMLNETGAHDNWHIRPQFAEPMKSFFAVHERHRQIEQDEIELEPFLAKMIQAFKAGLRGGDLVVGVAEDCTNEAQCCLLVINYEDLRFFTARLRIFGLAVGRQLIVHQRSDDRPAS